MLTTLSATLSLLLTLSLALNSPTGNQAQLNRFFTWAATYNKNYLSYEEFDLRYHQYLKKDQELHEIRKNHPDATFGVGHNAFSDRTKYEMSKRLSSLPEPV